MEHTNINTLIQLQKNQGVSAARNAGLDIFKGEYVSFVDSDDSVSLDFVMELLQNLLKYETDISVCMMASDTPKNRLLITSKYFREGKCSIKCYFDDVFAAVANKLFSGSLIKNERFLTDMLVGEDGELVDRLANKCRNISLTNRFLYYIFDNPNSLTRSKYTINAFYYFNLYRLSNRLRYFYSELDSDQINYHFKVLHSKLLNAMKYENTLYKDKALESYHALIGSIYGKLSFKHKLIAKFPKFYLLYKKTIKLFSFAITKKVRKN